MQLTNQNRVVVELDSITERYFEYLTGINTPEKTLSKYFDKAKDFELYLCKPLTETRKQDILNFLNRTKVSPHTWNNYLTYLRQFFKWMQSELIMPDITAGIKRKKVERKFYKSVLPENVISELYQYFENRVEVAKRKKDGRVKPVAAMRDLAFLGLLISLGSRAGKTTLVKVGDIREEILQNGNITVVGIQDKGKESLTFRPIPQFIFDTIESYIQATGNFSKDNYLFRAHKSGNENRPISYNMMWQRITAGFKAIGVKNKTTHKYLITPHSLRHSLAEILQRKNGTEYTQKFLNHSHISTTQMYAGRNDERKIFESPPDIAGIYGR
jgi:integrase/recombinase XerD